MFFIQMRNGKDHSWTLQYVDEMFPFYVDIRQLRVFQADGPELGLVISQFTGIPYTYPKCTWYLPWCQFIFCNLVHKGGVIPMNPVKVFGKLDCFFPIPRGGIDV